MTSGDFQQTSACSNGAGSVVGKEVVDQEVGGLAVVRSEGLAIWRGVGEGDFLGAQVAAVQEGAPGRDQLAASPAPQTLLFPPGRKPAGISAPCCPFYLTTSTMRRAMPFPRCRPSTQILLTPQTAGSASGEQRQARCCCRGSWPGEAGTAPGSDSTRKACRDEQRCQSTHGTQSHGQDKG